MSVSTLISITYFGIKLATLIESIMLFLRHFDTETFTTFFFFAE
jgi:hypothetical protein